MRQDSNTTLLHRPKNRPYSPFAHNVARDIVSTASRQHPHGASTGTEKSKGKSQALEIVASQLTESQVAKLPQCTTHALQLKTAVIHHD